MKPGLVFLLALAALVSTVTATYKESSYAYMPVLPSTTRRGSNTWGLLSILGSLIIISALFGNRGTHYRVVYGLFNDNDAVSN